MPNSLDERVSIIAPVGQDAVSMATFLKDQGFEPLILSGLGEFCQRGSAAGGMLLVTEEALQMPDSPSLLECLKAQPPWSELPIVILTKGGETRLTQLLDLTATAAGSLTLLERPISSTTLLRSVHVALRSRRRQYQVRDLLREQQRQQQALRESEERYRTLVEQVKDYAIFRTDNEGRPTSWNEGVRRILGFEESEFIGQNIIPLIFTPEDLEAGVPEQEFHDAAKQGTGQNDRWMRRKDGTRFYASGVTTGLRNAAGEHIGFTKVLRDRTSSKQAQEALAEARTHLEQYAGNLESAVAERTRELRATNEQLEAFVYSIAHDLRAPLRSMSGYSQLLLDDHTSDLNENARDLLNRIQASSEFMDKLLLDLLAFGRTARAEMKLSPVQVSKAWRAALFQYTAKIEQVQAQIETVEPLPTVVAHEVTLGQCLANLLSNALKFTDKGVRPSIRFCAEERGDHVRLWLEDKGIGIPAPQYERVFRVFERLNGSRYQGTGIGLSIVRKGVERMNGTIGLESEPGNGTRFWIELPKAKGK
ncbi:MAG: sensor histidine kinase [Verrucomicrobiota bacterium]